MLVGAGAMIAGFSQLSYSLVVIMLETTNSFDLFIPMTIGIACSRGISMLCTQSLYDRSIRAKQMPFLLEKAPESTAGLKAWQIMSKNLLVLPSIADMDSVKLALVSTHQNFPVLNTAGNLVGLLPKCILVPLVEEK